MSVNNLLSKYCFISSLFDIGIFPLPEHTSVINEWIYQKSNHMLKNVLDEEKTLETDVFLDE